MGLFLVDELETRSLLSGFGRGFGLGRLGGLGGLGFGANSNPAVQATE